MLDLAAKYETELQLLFANITFDEKYKYLYSNSYRDKYKASDSTWSKHEFVSIHKGKILGYLKYGIDRDSNIANAMQIVNFYEPNIIFAKDLLQFLKDIFEKFNFRKLNFCCFIGNPIEEQYDKLCIKFGGRIVGIKKENDKLIDNQYYDVKLYEILKKDYLKIKEKNKK
jgi:hypothetical protein